MKSRIVCALACAWAACFAACSDDEAAGPGKPLELRLETDAVVLTPSETACVRLTLRPWNAAWRIAEAALEAAAGATVEGCKVSGWGVTPEGGVSVYVTDLGTGAAYEQRVVLSLAVGKQRIRSEAFVVRSMPLRELPVLHVTASAPVEDTETWIAGSVSIEGNGSFADLPPTEAKVRGRGNSTWEWEKKPYALKLDSEHEVLGMPAHKRWCLIANYMDKTLLRNRVAHYIAAHTGLAYTPRTEFAEVWFNGTYAGNYLVVEQIKVDPNRLAIDELTPEQTQGEALTGGYLLEMDSYFDEANKFRSSYSDMPVNIKSPDETIAPEQFRYIQHYFNEADNLLFDKEFRDPSAMFDIRSFVDFWIVNELMGNREVAHPKSFYLYKPRGGRLTAGPVWDFDYGTLTLADAERWAVKESNVWYARMFTSSAIRREARQRWEALYPFLQTVPDYIDAQRRYLAVSARRNFDLWPRIDLPHEEVQMPNGDEKLSFDEAVDRLIGSYRLRLAWLDAQIRSW